MMKVFDSLLFVGAIVAKVFWWSWGELGLFLAGLMYGMWLAFVPLVWLLTKTPRLGWAAVVGRVPWNDAISGKVTGPIFGLLLQGGCIALAATVWPNLLDILQGSNQFVLGLVGGLISVLGEKLGPAWQVAGADLKRSQKVE